MRSEHPTLIQSLQRGLHLIQAVGERGRAHPKELARSTGLALPTTYHLLRTLVHEGYLVRVDDGSYVLGGQLQAVARFGRGATVVPQIRSILQSLRDDWSASVYLAMWEDGEIRCSEVLPSPKVPRIDAWSGAAVVAHATALGKCILANLDPVLREEYLARHPLEPLTGRTIIDRFRLEREISGTADVAFDREETFYGVGCVAAPVAAGPRLGAVGVAVPVHRLRRNEELLTAAVRAAAMQILGVLQSLGESTDDTDLIPIAI